MKYKGEKMSEKTRLLIVDDDVNFRNTLSKILNKKGYETVSAKDGFSALELIKENAFDVVLIDIKMPVMDGVETYKKMKTIKSDIKAIMMTAFSADDLIRDAIKEGVYAVVRKPFDVDMIVNMIEKSKNGSFIAIVDDDPNIGKTIKNILEKKGYSVRSCFSGEDAISLAKDRTHNVFFIDMKLPVLNGVETYLEIKKINPQAAVVMMTAYRQEMDELVKQALSKGAYTCLYKPFDIEDVLKIIDEILQKKHTEK
jgi:DNA-binding NtrC family response regulator